MLNFFMPIANYSFPRYMVSGGRFFSRVHLVQTFFPRYNNFLWPRHFCPNKIGLFFSLLGQTIVWSIQITFSLLSGPDKWDACSSVICLGHIYLSRKMCLGQINRTEELTSDIGMITYYWKSLNLITPSLQKYLLRRKPRTDGKRIAEGQIRWFFLMTCHLMAC